MKQVEQKQTSPEVIRRVGQLTLYDRYGSMAYGVILRIIPEPEPAQAVLIDLFSSPQLREYAGTSSHTAGEIIRLARQKALTARSTATLSSPIVTDSTRNRNFAANDNVENTVFELSFCQGYSTDAIAEKLQLSQTNVLKSIYTYFKQLRSS
ncbi:hypothetical protein [Spirosoma lituiforme]